MSTLKTVVINDKNEIVQMGGWDVGIIEVNGQIVETNPLPSGWQVVNRVMQFDTVSQSWIEVGKATDKERIKQLEDMIINLLEVL